MKHSVLLCTLATALPALAQTTTTDVQQLDPVVISAQRSRQSSFDAPAAITAVTREVIEAGGPQVNLSEVLNRVPGISILNRQNYAQDLQLSIRGFGSRSTFGIRGVRLIVDGIPLTMPDGQGQASSISLSSAQSIEVLRGPMAQLYGNAAGGVVQVISAVGAPVPTVTAGVSVGPYGQNKVGFQYAAGAGRDAVMLDASRYATDGYRQHSGADRVQINTKWEREIDKDARFTLVANALEQPISQDPLGLTRAQWEADPKQAVAVAKTLDTRKSVGQQQVGAVYERRLTPQTTLTTRLYFGARDLANALSVPLSAQQSDTSAGGIVSFSRGYNGLGVQLANELPIAEGQSLRFVGGVELDRMSEDRKGFINNAGVQGALKRDEHNTVGNNDIFAQAAWDLTRDITATAGVRSSRVKFKSEDHFIIPPGTTSPTAPGNPDDSGAVDYSATNPVLGVTWRATPALHLYANAGRGFETPTFTELAYRNTGSGLNTGLRASRSRHAEIGAKWKLGDAQRLDLAVFDITTRDEIVVDTNVGGRSTFKNASRTTRRGFELQHLARLGEAWRTTLSLSTLRARFAEAFVSGSGAAAVPIPAGTRLAGTPERTAFAELAWSPRAAWAGFNAGIELVHTGKLYVNDANTDAVPAATVLNLRAGFAQTVGDWTFGQLLRVDNATDRNYAGSVIVNEGNNRFFEPALPRNWLVALTAKMQFR
jgi:iron complex outermembrane recepter protein